MKKVSIVFTGTLLAAMALFFACKKEHDTGNNNNNNNNNPSPGSVLFWAASDLGCGNITVECNGQSKTITNYFSNGAPACGTTGAATFSLDPGTYNYSASCQSKTWSGAVTITENNCSKIQLTGGSTGGSGGTTTGQAMFWSASDMACGAIAVNVNGITRQMTSYYASGAPNCGANGCATFDLSPGSYSYSASCSSKTWNGTVTVTANNCSKVQFTGGSTGGGGGTTTGKAMFWIASDLGCGNITVTCNGIARNISSFYSSGAPNCDAAGCANFDLNPGTYNYSASCSGKTWNGTITVTAGGCNRLQLTGGSTGGGGSTSGKAMFWVSSDLGCGNITVTCNGVTSNISSYYSSTPSCGATGCANFSFSPGTYSYSGKCSSKTWSGTVTITANGCSTVRFTN